MNLPITNGKTLQATIWVFMIADQVANVMQCYTEIIYYTLQHKSCFIKQQILQRLTLHMTVIKLICSTLCVL